jgi:hypothetical protein
MLVVRQSGKGSNASATGNDTSKILVMIITGTVPKKVMSPRVTTLPLWMTLPRTADWPLAQKAMLPKVGSFAKEGKDAMKSALVRGSILAEKGNFQQRVLHHQRVEVAKNGDLAWNW